MGTEDQQNLKQGSTGRIYHVSGHEVDAGGRGWHSNMYLLT